jgi:hypothetical protein
MKISIPIFLLLICMETSAVEQVSPPLNPHPIGTPVPATITFGDAYTTAIEIYDARITVVEVLRGEKAWDLLSHHNASISQPDPGYDYVLAHIKFEFTSRGKPGDKIYALREDQFSAFSSDGSAQYLPAKAEPPEPRLTGTLHSGDSVEGWIAFMVARDDRKPFMEFRADVNLLSHTGIGPAFQLY